MIGKMAKIMTLQNCVLTPDDGGGFTQAWQNIAAFPTVHVEIEAVSGAERFSTRQPVFRATHKVSLRFRDDILPGMRLVDDTDVVYNIVSVLDSDGRKKTLSVMLETQSA